MFDPAVLVDDDGRVFLYVGSGQKSNGQFGHEIKGLFVMELSSDMLTIISEPTIIMPADFNPKKPNYWEGPSIRHIGEWYYLVYPATDITGLNYAMSLFPDKDLSTRDRSIPQVISVWRKKAHECGISGWGTATAVWYASTGNGIYLTTERPMVPNETGRR